MERLLPVSYALVFLWGIAVLLGLVGLGRLVARAIGGEPVESVGWGLHAVWGMAAYLFVGGALALFGACGEWTITMLIGIGVATTAWTTARGGWPRWTTLAAAPWQLWPAFVVVALLYVGGLCWQGSVNPCDDLPAYYNFCEKLLTTGSFAEPFSWRRLASLGGHTLLQCTMLAHGSWSNAQAFEAALCPVILLGLMVGFRGGALARSPLGLFLALIAVTTSIIRENSASHYTGIVLFVGLFATLDRAERVAPERRKLLVIAGLVAAGACSLRAQNVPVAAGALGLFWLASWNRDRWAARVAFREALAWSAGLLGGLLSWMIMAFLSNGSPLFPLFQGGNNLAFIPLGLDGSLQARLAPVAGMLLHTALLPLLLCLLATPGWKRGLSAQALSISAVFASLVLAYKSGFAPDATTIPRYAQPLLVSASLATLMTAALSRRRQLIACVLGVILVATSLPYRSKNLWLHYAGLAHSSKLIMPFRVQTVSAYREAQALVPEGKLFLACSDFPFLFDHARNPIWIIDLPHACSPPPGLPYQKPTEEMKRYLRGLGVEYLVYVDPAESLMLYNRPNWQEHARGDVALWKIQAPFFLDFFDNTERLAASEKVLGRAGGLVVVQLQP